MQIKFKNKFMAAVAITLLSLPFIANAQQSEDVMQEWFILDPENDKVQGLSVEKAYQRLLQERPSETVTVAVIDSGVDIFHEDLKDKVWINEDEIADNGIDDDHNGYIDDVYGWNFIGGKEGNVTYDTYELTREYVRLKEKYKNVEEKKVRRRDREEYAYWKAVKEDFEKTLAEANQKYTFYKNLQEDIIRYNKLLEGYLGVDSVTHDLVQSINSEDTVVLSAKGMAMMIFNNAGTDVTFSDIAEELQGAVDYFGKQVNYSYNPEFDPRSIVGDDYSNAYEKGYGNNDVIGHDASHGTHVAGIIAANRNNNLGIKGVADNVKIMAIRAVPDGDERDKDVANAIIYAVDNGARVINMSFGKSYSPHKEAVDKAVKYAESKGVLLVHAAGNSAENIDEENNYPTRKLDRKKEAKTWLEIGASSWNDGDDLVGSFSNYGKETVDVFAPGVEIYSTVPDNKYASFNGTSMAAPSISGVAALIMSYYPELTAYQVKDIITQSSRRFNDLKVNLPGSKEKTPFQDLSISGGLVNAYEALKLAEEMAAKTK
jgi:cell wall-associated protease